MKEWAIGRVRQVRVKRSWWGRLLERLHIIKPNIKQVFDIGPFIVQKEK